MRLVLLKKYSHNKQEAKPTKPSPVNFKKSIYAWGAPLPIEAAFLCPRIFFSFDVPVSLQTQACPLQQPATAACSPHCPQYCPSSTPTVQQVSKFIIDFDVTRLRCMGAAKAALSRQLLVFCAPIFFVSMLSTRLQHAVKTPEARGRC